jgi:hypothetical protein
VTSVSTAAAAAVCSHVYISCRTLALLECSTTVKDDTIAVVQFACVVYITQQQEQ